MYRRNSRLEIADLKIRLFVEYCNNINKLYSDVLSINDELYKITSTSIIKRKQNFYSSKYEDLITQKQFAIKKYKECSDYINSLKDILHSLCPKELDLLYLRYERKYTLRQIGDIYHYSHMNISRDLDEILVKFN